MKVCGVPDAPPPAPEPLTLDRLYDLSSILAPWSRYVPGPIDAEHLRQLVQAEIERREAQGEST